MHWGMARAGFDLQSAHTAARAESKAARSDNRVRELERRLDHMTLINQALWELLRDGSSLTEEDLDRKVVEVDVRDGNLDGKIGAQVLACPSCGRNTSSRRDFCLICGAAVDKPHRFEG